MAGKIHKITRQIKTAPWIWLGIFSLLIRFVLGFQPHWAETLYSRALFQVVRWGLDYTFGLLPFPGSYLILALLILGGGRRIYLGYKKAKLPSIRKRLLLWGKNILSVIGALLFFFLFLWGFNYQRLHPAEVLGLDLSAPDSLLVEKSVQLAADAATRARAEIPGISRDTLEYALLPPDLEELVRTALQSQLRSFGYPASGSVRARMIQPGAWMMRLNVAGIYNPFSGEGNVSGAATAPYIPFTMAHEMSHGYGFGDEGSCNFFGILACQQSSDPRLRYSGYLAWWGYIARELRENNPAKYKAHFSSLPEGMKNDLIARSNNSRRFHGQLSDFGREVNNQYLKSQGIEDGIHNYNGVVLMVLAWERKFNP